MISPVPKLNHIEAEALPSLIDFERRSIDRAAKSDRAGRLWDGHFHLATYRYQQGAPPHEVRAHFTQAAEFGAIAWARRGQPDASTSRTPWDFGVMLGVVAAFGTIEQRQRAGAIERWKWFSPERDPYLLLADSLSQVQSFLSGTFDEKAAASVAERCNAENADRDARRFDGPLVQALTALHRRDLPTLQEMIAGMVREHEHRALRGMLQTQADGLVAVLPLGLVRLAREADLEPTIASPYVPLELLA